ncbi:MAG: amidase domain-containing protein [Clostridia bacterium]|nr:amidase domain-containing protein [Clostridia bacterium]
MKLYCLEGGVYYLVDTAQQSGNANEYLYMELPDTHMYVSLTYFIEVRATSAPSTGDTTKLKVINTRMITEYSANSNYNRNAARTYAYTYYNSRNPAYYSWPQDCANFVSQCLEAGGMAQIEGAWNSNSAWLHEKEPLNYSLTWSGANSFAKHWGTDATGEGYARGYECRYYLVKDAKANYLDLYDTVQIGNVIIKCNDSNPVSGQHAMIVCDKMLMDESITLAAHTEDTCTADLYTYLYQSQYEDEVIIIIRIKREA